MASESSEEETLKVTVSRDLATWLEEQAAERGVDRTAVLEELVAAHRAATDLDGDPAALAAEAAGTEAFDERIRTVVDERLADDLEDRIAEVVSTALADRPEPAAGEVDALAERVDELSAELDEKIQDVRERVIQVKREADAKAPEKHTHEELQRVETLASTVDDLQTAVVELEERIDDERAERNELQGTVTDLAEDLEETSERLQTVAWVVSDLREAYESGGASAVDRIKRSAAAADVQRATCENCGEGVHLSLLTEPNCPHCEATVADVEPASGWFGSPTLVVASQLESGE